MPADPAANDLLDLRRARRRLGTLIAVVAIGYAVLWLLRPVSADGVRQWIEPLGAVAPLAFLAVAVALGLALVPGPLLAGSAGLLFGAALGTVLSITAAVITGTVALLLARRVGGPGMATLDSRRLDVLSAALERHGLWAVVVQRLAPGVPDAPCSYAAGLLRVTPVQIALGTALGAAPRAFGYTAIGDSLDEPGSPMSIVGIAVVVGAGVVGALVARRMFLDIRREPPKPPPA
jgi:uncharacterized membrane protein YdjX (TVP38/TMEM64 family)